MLVDLETSNVSKAAIETATFCSISELAWKLERHAPPESYHRPETVFGNRSASLNLKDAERPETPLGTVTPLLHKETAIGLLNLEAPPRRSTWKPPLEAEAHRSAWKRPTSRKRIRKPQPHSPPAGKRSCETATGKPRSQRHFQRRRHRRCNV